jgi:hypothetical protein
VDPAPKIAVTIHPIDKAKINDGRTKYDTMASAE